MARKKSEPDQAGDVQGRALIDLPDYGLKCGDYGALPADVVVALVESGHFDQNAKSE